MLAFVDLLALRSKLCLIVVILNLIEIAYGQINEHNFDFSVRQTSYCLKQCRINSSKKNGVMRAKSSGEYDALCKQLKPINSSLESSQYFYSSRFIFDQNSENMHRVFIFDFNLVSGDVYIDFTRLNLENIDKHIEPKKNVSLIIALIANQFMTFRVFNLPSRKSIYLNDIKILLNGAANLDLMEKKGNLKIQVYHSPLYSYSTDRKEWVKYLESLVGIKNCGYVEYLSQFCYLSHIRIDLDKMILNLYDVSNFRDFVVPLEEIPAIDNNMDSEVKQYYFGKKYFLNVNETEILSDFDKSREYFAANLEPHIFLDIGQSLDQEENNLKIFIKRCDVAKIYNLILYVNQESAQAISQLKMLNLDENYCQIRVYVCLFIYFSFFSLR